MLHLVGSSILLYLIDDARSNKNQIIGYFTGLDPAGPLFDDQSCEVRFCKGDAEFTEAIHTNGNPVFGLGTNEEHGRNVTW